MSNPSALSGNVCRGNKLKYVFKYSVELLNIKLLLIDDLEFSDAAFSTSPNFRRKEYLVAIPCARFYCNWAKLGTASTLSTVLTSAITMVRRNAATIAREKGNLAWVHFDAALSRRLPAFCRCAKSASTLARGSCSTNKLAIRGGRRASSALSKFSWQQSNGRTSIFSRSRVQALIRSFASPNNI